MKPTNFKQLLEKNRIIIPIIQRDYAQGRTDEKTKKIRSEFLETLHKATTGESKGIILDFIYGTKKQVGGLPIFTPLDGQQRLTTLFLLHWYAKNVLSIESDVNLSHFTYMTHPAARQFCAKLADWGKAVIPSSPISEYIKEEKSTISKYIKEKVSWWIAEWADDPTIAGMLVMLDAIHEKFKKETSINLEKVEFYLFPPQKDEEGTSESIDDCLSEDVYIKMNARGLSLTPFEKVKGRILEEIENKEGIETKLDIALKFDGKWTDFMWDKDKPEPGKVTDGYFIRFIRFVCDTFSGERVQTNDFEMVKKASSKWKNSINEEIAFHDYLTTAFDCMMDTHTANSSSGDEKDPQQKLKADIISLFPKCRIEYSDKNDDEKTNREFNIEQTLLLYAFIIGYHSGIYKTNEVEFLKRLRWVRNLIWNSEVEMKDLKELLIDTKNIILDGLDAQVTKFNHEHLEQEKEKKNWLKDKWEGYRKALYALEDHSLIKGDISIVESWKDPKKCKRFCDLFQMEGGKIKDDKLLTRALLSMGPIWSDPGSWSGYERCRVTLMHQNQFHACRKDVRTIFALDQLLKDDELNSINDIKNYLESYDWAKYHSHMEKYRSYIKKHYPNDTGLEGDWNYYLAKYATILTHSRQGYFVWRKNDILAIEGKRATSGNKFWDIFLLGIEEVIGKNEVSCEGISDSNDDSKLNINTPNGKYSMYREVRDSKAYFSIKNEKSIKNEERNEKKEVMIDKSGDCVDQGARIVQKLLSDGIEGIS